MDVRGVHHVAMAVIDLDEAVETYRRLFGAEVERRGRVDSQGVEAAYLRLGSGRVELVSPLAGDTPVGRFLAKRGPGLHHVAFEVDDLRGTLDRIDAEGGMVIEPAPHPGFDGRPVAFVHPDSLYGVLAEVVASDG